MNVLIIGGAGFIGSHIVRECLASGHVVKVYTRPTHSLKRLVDVQDSIEVAYGDFMDDHAVSEALHGIDAVVHTLSTTFPQTVTRSAAYDVMSNLLPMIRLLDHCLRFGIHNLTYLSSGGTVYGEAHKLPIDEEHPRNPISLYGLSKLTIENYLHFIAGMQGISAKILRVSNPYGPSQNYYGVQGIVGVALGCLIHQRPFTIFGDGENLRDYIHVADVARAVRLAIGYRSSLTANISTAVGTSIIGLLDELATVTERPLERCFQPDRGIDVRSNVLANQRARDELGWTPTYALRDGLRDVVSALKCDALKRRD